VVPLICPRVPLRYGNLISLIRSRLVRPEIASKQIFSIPNQGTNQAKSQVHNNQEPIVQTGKELYTSPALNIAYVLNWGNKQNL
jgi:hypothetical protein